MKLTGLVVAAAAIGAVSLTSCSPSISVRETVRVADSPRTPPSPEIRVVEAIGITDAPQTARPPGITLTEAIRVTDSPRFIMPVILSITEMVRVADSPVLTPPPVQPPPPPITVTVAVNSPKTGEIWRMATTQNVSWTTTGGGIAYVDIYYSTDGGKSMTAVALKETNDGVYTWQVPNTPSKTVLVRVLAFNVKGETLTLGDSGLFTISSQ